MEVCTELVEQLTVAKSGMRTVIDCVDSQKTKCKTQRSATDDHNLTLQSYLYEISHYQK